MGQLVIRFGKDEKIEWAGIVPDNPDRGREELEFIGSRMHLKNHVARYGNSLCLWFPPQENLNLKSLTHALMDYGEWTGERCTTIKEE